MNRTRATRHAREAGPPQDAERLEEVFARCQGELLGMLFYLVGNAEDARDTLQETFLKCWRRRGGLSQIEDLRAWVFRVALNAARDARATAWRRRRRALGEGETTLVANHPGPEVQAQRREQLALVREALAELPLEQQEVFLLRQNGQMTYDQIARATSIPLGTVKTRMRLALARLRETLQSE
jgi:RNA polymerase sigma factor (sigma-70 family)